MSIPEVKCFTKEVMNRLKEVGDSEKLKSREHKWVIKDKEKYVFVDSWDAMIIMCKLIKMENGK